jgi:serine/threonine protein kinase/tetratricopeptide (TPR) repeat protein
MERIGRYELRDKLGQGGMGVVYRAFDTLLQRIVAVKVISATIDGNPDLRERFFREARAAGQLSHRNIITIHDLGEDEGVPYLAMEYLEGEDLQRRMAGHDRMSLSHKLDLAIEVCEGLEFAHTHAVVHRDIKPANIFITDNGTVKLLDFGLARLVTSELTHSNMMMGTLNYMAPEQVRGERADHRSDIFATGVVFYELLSGRKAFQGDSFAATLYKILQEVPEPLDRIDSTLPWQMVAIVERALAKPRDERYQQMSEMLRDLLAVRQQQVFSESPTGYRSVTGAFPSPLPQPAPGPGVQRPPSGGQRPPSGGQRPPSGGQRPISGGRQPPTDLDVTGQYNPPPTLVTPQPTPAPAPVAPTSRGPRAIVVIVMLGALALVVGGPIAYSLLSRRTPTAPVQPSAPATATSDDPAIQATVKQSLNAFQAGDYAGAARYADSVLLQIPNHPEARRIAARAREAADTIDRGVRDARSLFDAGRYDDAAEAAGSVLSVSPSNADAKRIMAESSARSRGRAVDDARARMVQAKSAAVAAAAPKLASSSYGVALAAEREAARLQKAGRVSDAAAKFYEAGGLFRSAEIAAQTAGAVTGQRSAAATAPPTAQPASPPPEPATNPTLPSMPVTPVERPTVPAPVPAPVVPPSAPATAPPPAAAPASPLAQPAPDPAAANAAAESAVRDVLGRYELALESRSMEALKRIWPSLGGTQQSAIRNEFEHARRIDVDLVDPHISVSGATATVTFVRHYELLPVGGPLQRADTPATMTLRRTDGGWVIDQLRFGSPR